VSLRFSHFTLLLYISFAVTSNLTSCACTANFGILIKSDVNKNNCIKFADPGSKSIYWTCILSVFRLIVAARFVRVLLFIRIVTGKDQLERATRRMVSTILISQ